MKICLNMIVKNEAHVIRRALESAIPFVDHFCIVDTGSTDGTQEIIKEYGTLYERPWVNFGHNRQEALELARKEPSCEYVLFLDADDVLLPPTTNTEAASTEANFPLLDLPGYTLPVVYGNTTYARTALIRADAPWRWEGVLHEYLTSDVPLAQGALTEPCIKVIGGGARSKNPHKFKEDAALLQEALTKDPGNARYAFYLAQSYKDAGDPATALYWYRRRAQMNGWVEENWYARYMVAQLLEWTERDGVAEAYLETYQYRPVRAEPMYHLAKWHRLRHEFALAYLYAKQGASMTTPNDKLFLDLSIYDWRLKEELALSAYYVGRKDEGHIVLKNLLQQPLPPEVKERVINNLKWYE